jgi:hypothetical protein
MFLLAGCNASETPILTITKANLSLNLTPNYNVSSEPILSAENGYVGQAIIINNTENKNESAMISILSFSMISLLDLDSNEFQGFMDNMFLGIFRLAGAHETETYNISDSYGQNVTVRAFDIPDEKNPELSELTYISSMKLDQMNYLYIFSSNKTLMNDIVKSLILVE